jgi:LysR family transcriptional activator of nhaA
MDGLNYHHLFYFWRIAKLGSIAKASVELQLTQPTISEQLRVLEGSIGHKLFDRVGRSLVLTATGHKVYRHAEKIFSLGQELTLSLQGKPVLTRQSLRIGVTPEVSAALMAWALKPIAKLKQKPHISVRRCSGEQALPLSLRDEFDVVLTTGGKLLGAHKHLLLECGTSFFGARTGRASWGKFPQSLDGRPLLLPAEPMRSQLQRWCKAQRIQPEIAGEFDDPEVALVLAESGYGVLVTPDVHSRRTSTSKQLKLLGKADSLRTRLYAFTKERRPKHPAIAAIFKAASDS